MFTRLAVAKPSVISRDTSAGVGYRRHLLFWALAGVGCGADLWTKHWTFSQPGLVRGEVWWWWTGHAGLQLSLNEGALFGLGQGGVQIFALFSVLAAIAIPVWLFLLSAAKDLRLTVALGCIMGGVLGNLYDRLGLPGLDWGMFHAGREGEHVYAVRDFILLAWRWSENPADRIVWPNFNVADALLVGGAASLLVLSMRSAAGESDAAGASPSNER